MEENIKNQNTDIQQDGVVTVGEWIITYLILAIPIAGLVMLFVWAFSGNEKPSKENWAKGMLLWMAIVFSLVILSLLSIGQTIYGLLN